MVTSCSLTLLGFKDVIEDLFFYWGDGEEEVVLTS
tara:strand:- start:245 stop:349 length:105 start_codon:yes stop_codon:yes gene_type:complete